MSDAVVQCTNLQKKYGNVEALRGVSLDIPRGGVFGLIGPNGAGKTTLFSLILGSVHPTAGEVRVLGHAPSELWQLQGKVGVLPQDAEFPPALTVRETLRFFARINGIAAEKIAGEIDRVLNLVDLASAASVRLRTLSHGMKKRVFVAQALLGEPELVLLDEPTSGLDPKHAHELGEVFRAQSATVVISSHNLAELEGLCSSAAILVKGQVVRSGSMEQIRNADREVHFHLASASLDQTRLAEALSGMTLTFDASRNRLTIRLAAADARSTEEATTATLSALLAQGASVKEVERGQSLLQTYLQVS